MNTTSRDNQGNGFLIHPIVARWLTVLFLAISAITILFPFQGSAIASRGDEAAAEVAHSDRTFVIRHARIFDGRQLVFADSVFVENGTIKAIGHNLTVPPSTKEIDASGETLLPGLIDSHTHDWSDSPRQALLFGVTTELNMGGMPKYAADLKQAEAEGKRPDWADMLSAGNVVTPPQGHGTEYGLTVPMLSSAAEAQSFVDARIAEGSDYIKIIVEDGHSCHFNFAKLSREELAASVAAAHKRGKMAIVHVTSQADSMAAIAAGADGLAHVFADSAPQSDFARQARNHHVFVMTTLSAIQTSLGTPSGASLVSDSRLSPFLSTDAQSHMKAQLPSPCSGKLENAFAAVKQLHEAGVPVLAGTDAPAPGSWNGASLHGELELLVRAGFSPADALAAATSVPAGVFHLTDRGRIAPGLRADLLLVRGNPVVDITATRDIVSIWKAGIENPRLVLSK